MPTSATTEHGASWMATLDGINSVRRPSERLKSAEM